MSDNPASQTGAETTAPAVPLSDARIFAIVCYVLFIAAFTNGITAIIGVVLAYVKRDDVRGTIWQSHFTNMIHVFWTSIAVTVLFVALAVFGVFGIWQTSQSNQFSGAVLALPVIAFASLAYMVWYLYRTVRGLMYAVDEKPYA